MRRLPSGRMGIIAATLVVLWTSVATAATTVSFQNGINGYGGTFDRRISERITTGAQFEFDGSTAPHYFIDGYDSTTSPPSPDEQVLIRFENIVGNGAGQIPPNAFILDAKLQYVTGNANTSDSGGPIGVAGLLQPFNSSTSYFTDYDCNCVLGSRGPWWLDGSATRPVGGYGSAPHTSVLQANVAPLVQQWVDGTLPNHGMAVQAGFQGTSNAWGALTSSYPVPDLRPKLTVTYTTAQMEVNSFQPGVNSYAESNVTMALVDGGSTLAPNDITVDGIDLTGAAFLDGHNVAGDSPDVFALMRFSNIFGAGAGQAPLGAEVAKGWLVLTTGNSGNARSPGPYTAHAMLRDWDTTSLYSSFGSTPGLQVADGDITPALDSQVGMINGSEVWFDITSYLEGLRLGATDRGLAVMAGTSDGWSIFFNGATDAEVRPRLVIASQIGAAPSFGGDFNGDGHVNAADYVVWRKTGGSPAQYNEWRANFGASGAPTTPQGPQILGYYDLFGIPNAAITSSIATQTADGITGADLTFGPGITQANLTNGFSANNWNRAVPGRDTALSNGDYFQFGITVDAGHQASLESLDLSLRRSAASAPMNFEIQASLDGFATDGIVISEFNYFGRTNGTAPDPDPLETIPFYYMDSDLPGRPNATTSAGDPIPTVDLSVFSQLQNLPQGTEVTFRLYAWGDATTAASNTLALGRVTGPLIRGTVTAMPGSGSLAAVPEPSSAALVLLMGFVLQGCVRRRC